MKDAWEGRKGLPSSSKSERNLVSHARPGPMPGSAVSMCQALVFMAVTRSAYIKPAIMSQRIYIVIELRDGNWMRQLSAG